MNKKRVIAMDMDGTITQHKTHLEPENRAVLDELRKHYHLVMVGAGSCMRIHNQLDQYPIDVIGCYGMEYAHYDHEQGKLIIDSSEKAPAPDQDEVNAKAQSFRDEFGFNDYAGDSVEFHATGMMTLALIGTKAKIEDKLAFDPDRSKRRPGYPKVCELFSDYTVFIGGSSSYDIVPHPYNKLYALDRFCEQNGYTREDVVYFGDDYGPGGNDFQVYDAGVDFITIDNYHDFGKRAQQLLDAVKE